MANWFRRRLSITYFHSCKRWNWHFRTLHQIEEWKRGRNIMAIARHSFIYFSSALSIYQSKNIISSLDFIEVLKMTTMSTIWRWAAKPITVTCASNCLICQLISISGASCKCYRKISWWYFPDSHLLRMEHQQQRHLHSLIPMSYPFKLCIINFNCITCIMCIFDVPSSRFVLLLLHIQNSLIDRPRLPISHKSIHGHWENKRKTWQWVCKCGVHDQTNFGRREWENWMLSSNSSVIRNENEMKFCPRAQIRNSLLLSLLRSYSTRLHEYIIRVHARTFARQLLFQLELSIKYAEAAPFNLDKKDDIG